MAQLILDYSWTRLCPPERKPVGWGNSEAPLGEFSPNTPSGQEFPHTHLPCKEARKLLNPSGPGSPNPCFCTGPEAPCFSSPASQLQWGQAPAGSPEVQQVMEKCCQMIILFWFALTLPRGPHVGRGRCSNPCHSFALMLTDPGPCTMT